MAQPYTPQDNWEPLGVNIRADGGAIFTCLNANGTATASGLRQMVKLMAESPRLAELLIAALPYVETAAIDDGYDKHEVTQFAKAIKATLTKAGVI